MGAGNVVLTYTHWATLDAVPFRVLAFMAVISLDKAHPPVYWGGRDPLVRAMGRVAEPYTSTDYRALARVVQKLVDEGALSVDKPAHRGSNAVYSLHIDRRKGGAE